MEEAIWVNVIPNDKKTEEKHPDWVAPRNPKSPEGKNWTIGVKVGGSWYSQAAFGATTDDGQATGGVNVSLKPNDASKSSTGGSGQPAMGGYKKPFPKTGTYGSYKR